MRCSLLLDTLAALLAIVMMSSHAEATNCSKTPDLLENCEEWTACVKSAGVGCFNPYYAPGNTLNLMQLQISGTIPINVGEMTELNKLYLHINQLSGTIPDAIDRLTKLDTLWLDGNKITGAGPGLCAIKDHLTGCGITPCCDFASNPDWTNGAMCPACLNSGPCKPPVTCSGSNAAPLSPLSIDFIVGAASLLMFLVLCAVGIIASTIASTWYYCRKRGRCKQGAKIASPSSLRAGHDRENDASFADPLLFDAGSISGSGTSIMMGAISSMEAGNYGAVARAPSSAAAVLHAPPLPPPQKKQAKTNISRLASSRIDPADLSPFLDDAKDPILLGRGGFGAVFLANLRGHDDVVAVKMVRDAANPRAAVLFRKEYRLHLRLSMRCEGVCRMFGICENHALFKTCFVMKRYKCSLLDEIKAVPGGGGITMERVLALGATVARTMATLHVAHNLIVADLKPSNILIDQDGTPVISDFGVARVVATPVCSFGVTANNVGGTYNFESPEQLDAEDDDGKLLRVTMQSDVWSFACTLVHALTGVPPWWHTATGTLRSQAYVVRQVAIQRSPPPELGLALALPDISPELNVLLSECFAFDANLRPPFFSNFKGDGDDRKTPILNFGRLGIAVILARLRDRGVFAGNYSGGDDGAAAAAAAAAYAAATATTEADDEEEDVDEVKVIRDDIKDAIAAAMAALADYEGEEGWEG